MELTAEELLRKRRSIRQFKNKPVPDELIMKVIELSRFAPSSYNSQSFYFVIVKNEEVRKKLGNVRPGGSTPILNAPIAVAICSDPAKTSRPFEDACIATYQFMLAARTFGLGTCWIAEMNNDYVKELLNIPKDHVVSTVTPLGFIEKEPEIPKRKKAEDFVKWVK